MRRWSKLQKALYSIIDPSTKFEIHCVAYPMRAQRSNNCVPRYWVTIDKKIVWDFPKVCPKEELDKMYYPYCYQGLGFISQMLRDYIDCHTAKLLDFGLDHDRWGLVPILKACDKRIGKRRLKEIQTENPVVKRIINQRLDSYNVTWQDICIIVDTPITIEFAKYVAMRGGCKQNEDILCSWNYDHKDEQCRAYEKKISELGLDWKLYDPFSLSRLRIQDKTTGLDCNVMVQSKLFWTDFTPVVRFESNAKSSHFPLILKIEDAKILYNDDSIDLGLIEKCKAWTFLNRDILLKHWNNEYDTIDVFKNIKSI